MVRFAYLDESGDASFKVDRGAPEYLVMAIVLVDDPLPLSAAIDQLRVDLGFPARVEFAFRRSNPDVRRRFLDVLRSHDVTIRATVINKVLAVGRPELTQVGDFFTYALLTTLVHHREAFERTRLTIDERAKSKTVKRALAATLRQAVNTDPKVYRLANIAFSSSLGNNLIQAADMVAGAVASSYARNDDQWLAMIEANVEEIRSWDGIIVSRT